MSGTFISTRSGRFDLANPRAADVDLGDIAHGLSQICRWGGQCAHFYSVAQHSLLVLAMVRIAGGDRDEQRQALLHDAHEAYVGDVPSPLKKLLGPHFDGIDLKARMAVAERFGFDVRLSRRVEEADGWALESEAHHWWLSPKPPMAMHHEAGWSVVQQCWQPKTARGRFLRAAEELGIR